jgi:hypothetical protein
VSLAVEAGVMASVALSTALDRGATIRTRAIPECPIRESSARSSSLISVRFAEAAIADPPSSPSNRLGKNHETSTTTSDIRDDPLPTVKGDIRPCNGRRESRPAGEHDKGVADIHCHQVRLAVTVEVGGYVVTIRRKPPRANPPGPRS